MSPTPNPQYSDVLLSLYHVLDEFVPDPITGHFNQYFRFQPAPALHQPRPSIINVDPGLAPNWPPIDRFPQSYVAVSGVRGTGRRLQERFFVGDVVWLFYFEKMGIFEMIGAIQDEYATKGKIAFSFDDHVALILETMVESINSGNSSRLREREALYNRCLGWTVREQGFGGLEINLNSGFNNAFHGFLKNALYYYSQRRLSVAIAGAAGGAAPLSLATLRSIQDNIRLLYTSLRPFEFGRNYFSTFCGIVWLLSVLSVIRESRLSLGISPQYTQPEDYLQATYELLVQKSNTPKAAINRYQVFGDLGNHAREILIDIEQAIGPVADTANVVEGWLDLVEDHVEGYRAAYLNFTGVDLGAPPAAGVPKIVQAI